MENGSIQLNKRGFFVEAKFTQNKKRKTDLSFNLSVLPEELIVQVFSHLSMGVDLYNISLVCRDWKRISEDDYLWSFLLTEIFEKKFCLSHNLSLKPQLKKIFNEIDRTYPKWVKEALGGAKEIAKLPFIHTDDAYTHVYMLNEKNKEDLCNLPAITHIMTKTGSSALFIRSCNKDRSYLRFYLCLFHKLCHIIDLSFSLSDYPNGGSLFHQTAILENYFTRLIQGKPCGKFGVKEKYFENFEGDVRLDQLKS